MNILAWFVIGLLVLSFPIPEEQSRALLALDAILGTALAIWTVA